MVPRPTGGQTQEREPVTRTPSRPGRRTRGRRPGPLAVVMLVLLVGFALVTVDVLWGGPLRAADHQIDRWVLEYTPRWVRVLCRRYLVLPGQRLVNVPPMAIAAALLARKHRTFRPLAVPLVVMVFLAIVVPGMKLWTGRTNPLSGHDLLWAGGTEYPSGHEMNAVVVWGMFFALASMLDWPVGRWLTRRRQMMLTGVMIVWVGITVMIARTHWFSDVVASLCTGIPLLWLILRVGFLPGGRSGADWERRTSLASGS